MRKQETVFSCPRLLSSAPLRLPFGSNQHPRGGPSGNRMLEPGGNRGQLSLLAGGATRLTRRLGAPEPLPPAVVSPGRLLGQRTGSSQGQPHQSAHFQIFSCR